MKRHVSSWLEIQVHSPARVVLQISAATAQSLVLAETLALKHDDREVLAREIEAPHGGRWHVVDVPAGRLLVDYRATLIGTSAPAVDGPGDEVLYLRASRYAESDRLFALARAEFGGRGRGEELLNAVSSWVGNRLYYLSGWSRPTDGAVETLLAGQGVCRDFAHLVLAILRAMDVPARMVAVYAPGLSPMDFHAVVEASVNGQWLVVDPTGLAPRTSMVRIATGRDASDTAFLSSYFGEVVMLDQGVSAVVDGELPRDDHSEAVTLA